MFNSALIISILALLFTVFSFWWMNWRKGKLHVNTPRSYAVFGSVEGKMVLEFPFVFFNDGPMPIIIQNLRIIIIDEESPHPLLFMATVRKLGTDEDRALATQFPVRGREALLLVCEFQRQPGNLLFENRSYKLELQGKLDDSKKWKCISPFLLNVSEQSAPIINKQLTARDNMAEE